MNVDWLVPCRFAEANADGTMTITGAGTDTFWIPRDALPAEVGLFLAMRFTGSDDDLLNEHNVDVGIFKPDGEPAGRVTAHFKGERPLGEALPEGIDRGILLPLPVRIVLNELGSYRLALEVDGAPLRDVVVSARLAEQAPSAQRPNEETTAA